MSLLFYKDLKKYSDSDILALAKMYKLSGGINEIRWSIARKHFQKAQMLSGGVMSFVEKLPQLQNVAERRGDNSFPDIDKEYISKLLELIKDQKQFKRDLRNMSQEQKKAVEGVLNQREDALKALVGWGEIQLLRERLTVPQQYFDWVLKSYINGSIKKVEDVSSRLKPAISDFEWLLKNKKIDKREKIQQLNGLAGLEDFLDKHEEALKERRLEIKETEQIRARGKILYDGKDIKIIQPITEEGACYYGKGTRWCTAATQAENMFERYNKDGPLFIIQPKNPGRDGKEKYQLHFESVSFMDEKDEPIDFLTLLARYPEIKVLRDHTPWFYLELPDEQISEDDLQTIKGDISPESAKLVLSKAIRKQRLKMLGYLLDNFDIIDKNFKANTANLPEELQFKFIDAFFSNQLEGQIQDKFGIAVEDAQYNVVKYFIDKGYKPTYQGTEDRYSDLEMAMDSTPEILKLIVDTMEEDIKMPIPENPELVDILIPRATNKEELLEAKRGALAVNKMYKSIKEGDNKEFKKLLQGVMLFYIQFDGLLEKLLEEDVDPVMLEILVKSDSYKPTYLKKFINERA